MAAANTLRINGKDYRIDDLTLDEAELLEDTFDCSLDQIDFKRAKVLKQVVFLLLRRDNPKLTIDEVGAIKVVSLTANGNGSPKRARASRR